MRSKRQSSRVKADTCLKERNTACGRASKPTKEVMKGARRPTTALKTRHKAGREGEAKTQTAQGDATEPRPHTAAVSRAPILLLSLGTSHCIRVSIQPPATHSNNPNT